MKKSTSWLWHGIIGIVSFLIFLFLFLPLESVVGHYIVSLPQYTKGKGDFTILTSDLEASMLSGVRFKDFRLLQGPKLLLEMPELEANVSFLKLLSGQVDLEIAGELAGGKIEGELIIADNSSLQLQLTQVNVMQVPAIKTALMFTGVELEIKCLVSGDVDFSWGRDARERDGAVKLSVQDFKIPVLNLKSFGLKAENIILSDEKSPMIIDGTLDGGQIILEKFKIPGPDLSIDMSGRARLGAKNDISQMNIRGSLKMGEEMVKKVPLVSMLDSQKDAEGAIAITLQGNLEKPRFLIGDTDISQLAGW